nr:unnamed protein product [Digitaria exilis]CAB3469639.1 unnamed protein product [Digitaria exilis]
MIGGGGGIAVPLVLFGIGGGGGVLVPSNRLLWIGICLLPVRGILRRLTVAKPPAASTLLASPAATAALIAQRVR